MLINPFITVNKNGIPRLEATGVTVGTSSVEYSFKYHPFFNNQYVGLIIFKLPSFTAPTTAVPITFTSNAGTNNIYTYSGDEIESSNTSIAAGGIFIGFYESGTLKLFGI